MRMGDILRSIDDEPLDYRLGCSALLCEHLLSTSMRPIVLKLTRPSSTNCHNLNNFHIHHSSYYKQHHDSTSQAHTSTPTLNDKVLKSNTKSSKVNNVDPVSLVLSVDIAELSVLLLHHHQLFAYAMLQGISLNMSKSPPGGIMSKNTNSNTSSDSSVYSRQTNTGGEPTSGQEAQEEIGSISCSASLQYLNVLDLTPQGLKHRDVIARPQGLMNRSQHAEFQPILKLDFKSDNGVSDLNVSLSFPHCMCVFVEHIECLMIYKQNPFIYMFTNYHSHKPHFTPLYISIVNLNV